VFNKTCAISYPNFKFSFPIWMLGKAHKYLEKLALKDKMAESIRGLQENGMNGGARS
jgi:lanosterol synthase